jgi:hypothetical protein
MACELEKRRYDEAQAAARIARNEMDVKRKVYFRTNMLKIGGVTFKKAYRAFVDAEKVYIRAVKKTTEAQNIYRKCLSKSKRLSGTK